MEGNVLEIGFKKHPPSVVVKLYHRKFSNNADSDLNEIVGLTDLTQK